MVEGPEHEVFPGLPPFTVAQQEVGRAVTVGGFHQEHAQLLRQRCHRPGLGAQGVQEGVLQVPAQGQDRGMPLPGGVHAGEGAIVQFVADVERQLMVLPPGVGGCGVVGRQGGAGPGGGTQERDEAPGQGSARLGKDGARTCGGDTHGKPPREVTELCSAPTRMPGEHAGGPRGHAQDGR